MDLPSKVVLVVHILFVSYYSIAIKDLEPYFYFKKPIIIKEEFHFKIDGSYVTPMKLHRKCQYQVLTVALYVCT